MPLRRRRTLFARGVCPHVGWLVAATLGATVALTADASSAGQPPPAPTRTDRYLQGHAGLADLVEMGLPAGVWVPAALQPAVRRLLLDSTTFRRQCARLARHPSLHIGITQDDDALQGQRRAMAQIRRYESGLIVVIVTVASDQEPYETLAHELEHVLEYLDRGSLRVLALSGARQSEVWASSGAVETRRAIEAGERAAREVERAAMLSARARGSSGPMPGLKR